MKNYLKISVLLLFAFSSFYAQAQVSEKPRIIVTTDIGSGDPDDRQSMIRLLVYANEFDIEGLIAVRSGVPETHPEIIRQDIEAYEKVLPNLKKHAQGYPSSQSLMSVVASGWKENKIKLLGRDSLTEGARLIIKAADKNDVRPLWITIWGGAATLAQAIYHVQHTRDEKEVERFISKLRVYAISDQDETGIWLRNTFPKLFYIVTPSSSNSWFEYYKATWAGISGDRFFNNGGYHHFDMVDSAWLKKNIMENHGALGMLYPQIRFIMEGDTPSFLGLIDNGLKWSESPDYGGWGGRYQFYQPASEQHPIWTNNMRSRDKVRLESGCFEISDQATIWRWREDFQNDFAARINWCVAVEYAQANHNPKAVINGDTTKNLFRLSAVQGAKITLSGLGSSDPDKNRISFKWWIYDEAGTLKGATLSSTDSPATTVNLPNQGKGKLHVILKVTDNGSPNMVAYRRALIEVR